MKPITKAMVNDDQLLNDYSKASSSRDVVNHKLNYILSTLPIYERNIILMHSYIKIIEQSKTNIECCKSQPKINLT